MQILLKQFHLFLYYRYEKRKQQTLLFIVYLYLEIDHEII